MLCSDCQFNLLCHAGRLDSWSKHKLSIVQLCPLCNRLSVGFDTTLYIFSCEQRQLTAVHLEHLRGLHRCGELLISSAAQIKDLGPGLIGKLSVGLCVACLEILPPQLRDITVKYLDEQREEKLIDRIHRQQAEAIQANDSYINTPEDEEEKEDEDPCP